MTPERDGVVPSAKPSPLFTAPFLLICLATGFFYVSFYLILPVMPLYLQRLGATPAQIGLIIGYFAAMAMLVRLPCGWLIDRKGTRPILVAGMAIFLLGSLGYTLVGAVNGILALRLFHGVGMGLFPTAATVVVAELAPPDRRGEAMGWFGVANAIGLIGGPVLGPVLAAGLGFTALFLIAAGLAALGIVCVLLLPAIGRRSAVTGWGVRWTDLFSRAAVLPSLILLFLYIPYGTVLGFVPILATRRGLENPGLFYTAFAVAMLLVRARAGRVSDRHGRAAVIVPGMVVAAAAMAALARAETPLGVLAAAALFGLGTGTVQPTLMALTTDRVSVADRGKAMGTFYTAWEAGIAIGSAGSGWLLASIDFPALLLGNAILPVIGAALALRARAQPRP